jgi:zona occludens toxin (predicted ATPase)
MSRRTKYIIFFGSLLGCIVVFAWWILHDNPFCIKPGDPTPIPPIYPQSTLVDQATGINDFVVDARYSAVAEFYSNDSSICEYLTHIEAFACSGDISLEKSYRVFVNSTPDAEGLTTYRMFINYEVCGESPD